MMSIICLIVLWILLLLNFILIKENVGMNWILKSIWIQNIVGMQTTSLPNIFASAVESDNNYCSDKFECKYEVKSLSSKPGISFVEECGVDDGFVILYIPFSAYDFIETCMSDCLTIFYYIYYYNFTYD